MKEQEYLDRFENKLQQDLLRLCSAYKMLNSVLLANDDIDDKWTELAPEYIADAIEQIQEYPTVSLAWASYLGLAIAYVWDVDWKSYKKTTYQSYYGEQGFDDMDEHIIKDILRLPLDSEEAKEIEEMIRRCAQVTIALIRNEQVEPQSPLAFHIYARAVRVMYRIGAALELKRLGYNFQKVNLGDC